MTFQYMMIQRNHGEFTNLITTVKKLNRKIMLLFHYFSKIKTHAGNLFCKGDIQNIDGAIEIYEKFHLNSHFVYQAKC